MLLTPFLPRAIMGQVREDFRFLRLLKLARFATAHAGDKSGDGE
jgi:hypothetical protein